MSTPKTGARPEYQCRRCGDWVMQLASVTPTPLVCESCASQLAAALREWYSLTRGADRARAWINQLGLAT